MKFAACFSQHELSCQLVVTRMARAQECREWHKSYTFTVPGGAIGYTATSERHSAFPLFHVGAHGNLLMISGVPTVAAGSVDAVIRGIVDQDFQSAARSLSSL